MADAIDYVFYSIIQSDVHGGVLITKGDNPAIPEYVYRDRYSGVEHGSGPYFQAKAPYELKGEVPVSFVGIHDVFGRLPSSYYSRNLRTVIVNSGSEYLCINLHYRRSDNAMIEGTATRYKGVCEDGKWVVYYQYAYRTSPRIAKDTDRDIVIQWGINALSSVVPRVHDSGTKWYRGYLVAPQLIFDQAQHTVYSEICEFGWYRFGSASRFSAAYVDACSSLPDADVNVLENVLQSLTFVKKALSHGFFKAIKDSISALADVRDAWLTYRYVVKTTELDIDSYKDLITRLQQLAEVSSSVITAGGHYQDDTGSYRAELKIPLSSALPSGILQKMDVIGADLSASNLWDIVPYSFIVDWFYGVSDLIEWFEEWDGALALTPSEIWYTYMHQLGDQHTFYRVPGKRLSIPPAYSEKKASAKTIVMRCADVLSIFTK